MVYSFNYAVIHSLRAEEKLTVSLFRKSVTCFPVIQPKHTDQCSGSCDLHQSDGLKRFDNFAAVMHTGLSFKFFLVLVHKSCIKGTEMTERAEVSFVIFY